MPLFNRFYRYNHSGKGRARWNKYYQKCDKEGLAKYKRERYHKIQDEAGCHHFLRDFYPGYRLLKSLEEAEVVEI